MNARNSSGLPPGLASARTSARWLPGVWLVLALTVAGSAHATLGGDAASVENDRLRMSVKHAARVSAAATTAPYTVHETSLPSGTVVRQYLSATGTVFAVTWKGPFKPDLQQLMGPHFDTMNTRQAGHVHAGHPYISQQNTDLVVESFGHPRSFVGRAYLPAAVPAGVTVQEIQ